MSSRAPQSSGDRSRDTVLPSFRESFPGACLRSRPPELRFTHILSPAESVFGHPQVARSAPSAPPFHNGVTSGGHPQRYPQPSLPPARTPPSNLRPTSPQLHPASVPQGRGHGGQGQGGQFLILESNPNGRLQISATSSSSMQHAEWMHSGTAPPAPEAAEQSLDAGRRACVAAKALKDSGDRCGEPSRRATAVADHSSGSNVSPVHDAGWGGCAR
ncbi:hypothetical protein BKA62DRAFT_674752 [Auriculariales sp. MPI-PUGE-AT-0066]|nr:hypothetical protein BKA62DRAFT_674752 [Auriculariales sp. MPI-PUGE-AT-0066]